MAENPGSLYGFADQRGMDRDAKSTFEEWQDEFIEYRNGLAPEAASDEDGMASPTAFEN